MPEDRLGTGLAASESIWRNAVMRRYGEPPVRKGPFLSRRVARKMATTVVESVRLSAADVDSPVRALSGGHAQRLLTGRELQVGSKVLILAFPTRGLDVSAVAQLRQTIVDARDRGVAILLISEELDEIIEMADRVIVMYEGKIAGEFTGQVDRAAIGRMMGGSTAEAATSMSALDSVLTLRIERRPKPGGSTRYRLGSVAIGVIVSTVFALVVSGASPDQFFTGVWNSTLGTPYGVQYLMILTTPLILTGLAAAIPLRIGLWNIGGDGQLFLGAWAAFAVGVQYPRPQGRVVDSADADRRSAGRGGLGAATRAGARLPRRQRDHQHADVQLHRRLLGAVLGRPALARAALGRQSQVTSRSPSSRSSRRSSLAIT